MQCERWTKWQFDMTHPCPPPRLPSVYRTYTQAELDAQYNNQAKISVPKFQEFVRECAVSSAQARGRWRAHLNQRYGALDGQILDIFMPDRLHQDAPVEIFLHGGYWRMFGKDDFSYVANGFAPHGIITIVVNYMLIPTVSLDALVGQCQEAVVWTYRHIRDFGGNPDNLFLSGHSAGGHLTALLLSLDWSTYDGHCPIRGATAISGIFDLEPIRLSYLNSTLGFTREVAARNSPILLPAPDIPLDLHVGDKEGDEYIRQSAALAHAWRKGRCPPVLHVQAREDHFSIRAQLGVPNSGLVKSMLEKRIVVGAR